MHGSMISNVQQQKEKLIKELFIETGDEDYLMARWLYINDLPRQFFWSAAQALEKYLKAVILIKGDSVKAYSHNLVNLFAAVKLYDTVVIPVRLDAPCQVKAFSDPVYDNLWGDVSTENFVNHIYKEGHPSNRYDYFGINQNFSDIYKLDQVVFVLRTILDEYIGIGAFKVPRNISGDDVFQSTIYENNFPFAPKDFKHQDIGPASSKTVTSLRVLFKNDAQDSEVLRKWVKDNIRIKDDEISRLKA